MTLEYVPFSDRDDIVVLFELDDLKEHVESLIATAEATFQPDLEALKDRLDAAAPSEVNPTWESLGIERPTFMVEMMIADMLEKGCGVVSCPFCEATYLATELVLYDESSCNISGRLFTCPEDHRLYYTRERIGSAMITPYVRKRRERGAKASWYQD